MGTSSRILGATRAGAEGTAPRAGVMAGKARARTRSKARAKARAGGADPEPSSRVYIVHTNVRSLGVIRGCACHGSKRLPGRAVHAWELRAPYRRQCLPRPPLICQV